MELERRLKAVSESYLNTSNPNVCLDEVCFHSSSVVSSRMSISKIKLAPQIVRIVKIWLL